MFLIRDQVPNAVFLALIACPYNGQAAGGSDDVALRKSDRCSIQVGDGRGLMVPGDRLTAIQNTTPNGRAETPAPAGLP